MKGILVFLCILVYMFFFLDLGGIDIWDRKTLIGYATNVVAASEGHAYIYFYKSIGLYRKYGYSFYKLMKRTLIREPKTLEYIK